MAVRQWRAPFVLAFATLMALVSGTKLLMPTCSLAGACVDEDGASMLQTGGSPKLREPNQDELLVEEDEEDEEGLEQSEALPAAQALAWTVDDEGNQRQFAETAQAAAGTGIPQRRRRPQPQREEPAASPPSPVEARDLGGAMHNAGNS
eukprot:CAMPEP_0179045252 /NCGR_PEP_ID=MMETSP0796-20121207/18083_1 /TAXON_ID=73915 /ORGANISM="Pyrodinium bahamense, Strain pbaha01" /LENGTH=148 /DNA_ID=CAMNT_0020741655 /DNA_START=100 /DNA_END=545 /DNA_ORIENTATION=+